MSTKMTPTTTERKEYDLLPVDTYDVVIESIEDDTRKKYNSDEDEDYMKFTLKLTSEQYKDRKQWANVMPKLFQGDGALSPSKLYTILSAVNNRNYTEEELSNVTTDDINALEGKSMRILIAQEPNTKGEMRNKIKSYLPTKSDIQESPTDNPRVPVTEEDPLPTPPDEVNVKDLPF